MLQQNLALAQASYEHFSTSSESFKGGARKGRAVNTIVCSLWCYQAEADRLL